jgi:hypothetical protein
MGLFLGLTYREQLIEKYGEPLVSELDLLISGIQEHLDDVVKDRVSDLTSSLRTEIAATREDAFVMALIGT